jgi:hypothetical protein
MKEVYRVGDDIFVAMAFVSFVLGIALRILSISHVTFGLTYQEVLFFSAMCLMFSIALSLYDLNTSSK